jgi:methylase of polypeptide subunit release factors
MFYHLTIEILSYIILKGVMQKPHIILAHAYWEKLLSPTDTAIDATCGNGKDTAYLSKLLPLGKVLSLDIQKNALTKAALNAPHSNIDFLHQSHTHLPQNQPVKLVVYNLGYLPGGDKTITTMAKSTLQSLQCAATLIEAGGALSITCYPGHLEGALEEKIVDDWVSNILSTNDWKVLRHQWDRQSPILFFVSKKSSVKIV